MRGSMPDTSGLELALDEISVLRTLLCQLISLKTLQKAESILFCRFKTKQEISKLIHSADSASNGNT